MSATKRRATAAAEEMATPASKRRRVTDDNVSTEETSNSTITVGLRIVQQLRQSRDKNGRPVATEFLTLPDKKRYPEYYKEILLPIAIDTVEEKLNRGEYPNLSAVEGDLKRMVANAKQYNDRNSDIFNDAERIRKMLSNFMPKNNPAYKDPNYVAAPTPIPAHLEQQSNERQSGIKVTLRNSTSNTRNGRSSTPRPAEGEPNGVAPNFAGDTFQTAQEKIVVEMINHKNEDGDEIAEPFLDKPPRSEYPDYYQVIRHPVSLKSIQKEVKGLEGKNRTAGVSNFKTWRAFEDEMSFIWQNARQYNEDGTPISDLAGELETHFNQLVTEAKKVVRDPSQTNGDGGSTRLKINPPTSTKIKLKMSGQGSAAAGLETGQSGMAVDNDALQRQQEVVRAGSNGQGLPKSASSQTGTKNPFGGSTQSTTPIPALASATQERTRSASAASPALSASGVKAEGPSGQSPSITAFDASKDIVVAPASSSPQTASAPTLQAPASATPQPAGETPRPPSGQNNVAHPAPAVATSALDSRFRQTRKDAISALISNVSVSTHPGLKVERRFHIDIPPSPRLTQQSVTINLPSEHYYLRIIPTFSPNALNRPNKYLASLGSQRLKETKDEAGQIVYDTRILPGVNKIEIEMIVGVARGVPKFATPGQDIYEFERTTIFANLMRS